MKLSDIATALILSTAALSFLPSLALAQEDIGFTVAPRPKQTLTVMMGTTQPITTARPYSTVQIVDPAIFDVVPESDRRLNIVPKSPGYTVMTIYDKNNARMSEMNVFIQRVPKTADTDMDETFRGVPGRVKVHNDPKGLAGKAIYSCTPNCDLVKEVPTSFQAPKPVPMQEDRSFTSVDPSGAIVTSTSHREPAR